jgi:hypothetical protein
MSCDERLLQQIQRLVGLADACAHDAEDRLPMAAHDFGVGGLPARNAECRQLRVR